MAQYCAQQIATFTGKAPAISSASEVVGKLDAKQTTGVLICAPVLGNGHAMRSVARDLREAVPEASRHFIAGVGLPQTAEVWNRLAQFLTQSGDPLRPYPFSTWACAPVGVSPGRGIAWNRASQLAQRLDQLVPPGNVPWRMEDLLTSVDLLGDALENSANGFLGNSGDQELRLTRGFVYWNPHPEVLRNCHHAGASFLAMSAALQAAREHPNPNIRLATSIHEVVVLDPENFLRFNDGILQASVLRAALPHEVDYSGAPELSELMREFLEKMFINHGGSYGEAAPEFALALATGHLRLADKDRRILFERVAPSVKGVGALLGLLFAYMCSS